MWFNLKNVLAFNLTADNIIQALEIYDIDINHIQTYINTLVFFLEWHNDTSKAVKLYPIYDNKFQRFNAEKLSSFWLFSPSAASVWWK